MDTHEEAAATTMVPYTTRTILTYALVLGGLSLLFSFGMLYLQVANQEEHIAGTVVSVATSSLVITDARGATTTILLTPETRAKDIMPLESLPVGTPVMSVGRFVAPHTLEAEGIRTFSKPDKKRP